MKKHITIKNISFLFTLLCVIYFLGKNLLPSQTMFEFHDETQIARISEFATNIRSGVVPPRMAPHFSFSMGYPVFNFYAPFSYWVASSFTILGFDIADSFKLSVLLALITAYIGMYAFLRLYFKYQAALAGAVLYVASPWLASEIFVRGNLGEIWFWGLMPLALYAIYEMDEYESPIIFAATAFIISCTLTTHNIFSLLFFPIALVYAFITGNKIKNYLGIIFGLLLSAYFIVPLIFESSLTYAKEIATLTKYSDHFLCISQVWSAPFWGYGGSAPGCKEDGMAFMIGKVQIIVGLTGMLVYVLYDNVMMKLKKYSIHKIKTPYEKIVPVMLVFTLLCGFLLLYPAEFLWEIFSFVLSLFQFPWRFLLMVVFGISFYSAYFFHRLKFKGAIVVIILIAFYTLFSGSKYFQKKTVSKSTFNKQYLSNEYIKKSVAYKIPEYVPKTVKYDIWRSLENTQFNGDELVVSLDGLSAVTEQNDAFNKFGQTTSQKFLLNIHFFPYWEIRINNQIFKPTQFDDLGRPIVTALPGKKTVSLDYRQTSIEIIGNTISVLSFVILLFCIYLDNSRHKKAFKKIRKKFGI